MGTTRIKVIDLSSNKKEIKTSRKHAEKLTGVAKLKSEKAEKPEYSGKPQKPVKPEDQKVGIPESTDVSGTPTLQPSESSEPSHPSKPSKPSIQKHHLGKKYKEAASLVDKTKTYTPKEAIELLYKTSITKFDPTVEIHLNVSEKNLKGSVNLPHSVGEKKEKKFLIFSDLPASKAGKQVAIDNKHIIWGDEKTIDEIISGKLKPNRDFDIVIATPKFMPLLAKVAKVLGPLGLMPNPKNGTISENPKDAIKNLQTTGLEYKTDPTAAIIHTKIGKLSFKSEKIEENLKSLITAIGPTKIKKATIASTMSPGIRLDIATITQ